jgi:hypothetical protein
MAYAFGSGLCPNALASWSFFSSSKKAYVYDPTMTISCSTGENSFLKGHDIAPVFFFF